MLEQQFTEGDFVKKGQVLYRLDDVRYVVLFFTVDSKAQWETYAKVIEEVMDSHEFKSYMENG